MEISSVSRLSKVSVLREVAKLVPCAARTRQQPCYLLTALRVRQVTAVALFCVSPGGRLEFIKNSSPSFLEDKRKPPKNSKGS